MVSPMNFVVSTFDHQVQISKTAFEQNLQKSISAEDWWSFGHYCEQIFGKSTTSSFDLIEELDFDQMDLKDEEFVSQLTEDFVGKIYKIYLNQKAPANLAPLA